MPSTVTRHRFTVDEYYRMGEAGIFGEEGRVELLDGEIFTMSPAGPRHAGCVTGLQELLNSVWSAGILRVQQPLSMDDHSQPEPDLCVVSRRASRYTDRQPVPAEVLLLVEVSDTSQVHDRERKLPRYARAGIPEVWIVDLTTERVEVYRDPAEDGYRMCRIAGRGESVTPEAFPDLALLVEKILP